jgi:hypothetical protein
MENKKTLKEVNMNSDKLPSKRKKLYSGSRLRYVCNCGFRTDDYYEINDHIHLNKRSIN